MPKTNSLSIHLPPTERSGSASGLHSGLTSPTPRTPLSPHSPLSPVRNNEMLGIQQAQYAEGYDVHVRSPISALPPPPSPKSPKHKASKIFSNYKACKSTSKVNKVESPRIGTPSNSDAASSQVYLNRSAGKSSPDISSLVHSDHPSPQSEHPSELGEDRKDSVTAKEKDKRKEKHKFGHILGRRASLKIEDDLPTPRTDKPLTPGRDKGRPEPASRTVKDRQPTEGPIRTAPLEKERGFRSAMNSALRNRSPERQTNPEEEEENAPPPQPPRQSHTSKAPSTAKSTGPPNSSFIHSIKFSGSKAAEGVNKARKGFFGKLGRSASSHEREPVVKEPYELKVITLPLVEQTRRTRISKRLEKSKDKTEFWMPALPWRCIDYLNLNGTTSEGLYRVPELDINLFDQEDLYDVNTVSSMFKAWLRGLPELVFPQDIQNKIIEKCAKVDPPPTSTPQFLKDELSKLPPWNYYLLFAITCHISLLHNCSKDNKMTYANLNICFAPCLKVEGWIFQWLILDWKNCWQGCSSEREYLDKEYALLDEQDRLEDGGETASIATTRSKSSTAASSTMRSVPTTAPRSTSTRGLDVGGSYVSSRDRPMQHFDKHPPPTSSNRDQSHRPSTSHASLAAEQRTISSKESSRPSLMDDGSSNGGRSTPDHESTRYFPQPVQPASANGNNLQALEKKNRKDERSPNRPGANHIASQQRPKESSRERNHDRTVSSATKKEKHRPAPMQSMDTSEDRSSSDERNGNGNENQRTTTRAPELSPMKPLSPLMYD
ncbi:hypothetical protein BLS_003264 [Venturia inaequalis]|uniref:Rho-GAP domain-containing protein n=1 Tax=Venturia inaequalis TaxID=5025 RepID=A0A8H3UH06_VENIN|nr:hypothetical protein EG328_006647 [Venturia inaequalis]KAE9974114.1 hypothetical protein BLS_003264 [Venturia inaequalis]